MREVPYTNNQKHAVTIGSKTIRPGECRMVDASLLGQRSTPAKVTQSQDSGLTLVDRLEAGTEPERRIVLQELSDADLDSLSDEFDDDHPIAQLVKDEWLRRDNAGGILGALVKQSIDDIKPQLLSLTDAQLDELQTLEGAGANRTGLLKAITDEFARRADADA